MAAAWRGSLVCAFLVMCGFGRPASAETIAEALADAYLINPVLNAERARLRATDEEVALAKSGLRPFVFGTADTAFLIPTPTTSGAGSNNLPSDVGLLTGPVNQDFRLRLHHRHGSNPP